MTHESSGHARHTGNGLILLVFHLACGATLAAADAEISAIDRAKSLLASRDRFIAAVIVVDEWPSRAPSPEAFAVKETIYVNRRGNILRAAVRSTAFDVVLASLLLHEHSHLSGANESQALQIELAWLTAEHAGSDVIRATRQSIDREVCRSAGRRSPSRVAMVSTCG